MGHLQTRHRARSLSVGSGRNQQGFTLVEILVAMLIFAVIGLLSSQILSNSVQTQNIIKDRGERLAQIHRAMQVIQRDVMQFSERPVREYSGDWVPALLLSNEGFIEFSRVGWRNPLSQPRSELQRVGYRLQDGKLFRGYWRVLDRSYDTEPAFQELLDEVDRIEFYVLDSAGQQHKFWPPQDGPIDVPYLLAVTMRIEMAPFGIVERIWELPPIEISSLLRPGAVPEQSGDSAPGQNSDPDAIAKNSDGGQKSD